MPESVGKCASDVPGISALANEAQQRLLHDPVAPDEGWYGGYAEMAFSVIQGSQYVIAPADVARIISAAVCKSPVLMRNRFYEYLAFGSGQKPSGCDPTTDHWRNPVLMLEREPVLTTTALSGTGGLRAYATNPLDYGMRLLVQGLDQNGMEVYGQDILSGMAYSGEYLTLASPFVQSEFTYSKLTGLQKDVTLGDVQIFQVGADGSETQLSNLGAGETSPLYRRYYVEGLGKDCCGSTAVQVSALCKLDFVPAVTDTDYLFIQSIPALVDECMAVRYGRMDLPAAQGMSLAKHENALRLLFGQLDHVNGKPEAAVRRSIFGSARLTTQPV